ncbi:uncharacterized protein LOC125239993 isoform X2 [Leguminivora glycinivorella]|uniref:uncharacterized protein LOC125239993 isoform X2 n=1 Tax=Leguminivora glycinivorella TaxID=1035111 RepID=UPI002010060E|nr:uncharacterized protein LOC125239993 isoform X2 [Leguminivora glycinivorella]
MPIIKSAVNPEAKHAGTASAHVQLDFGLCRFCEALGEHINMAAQQATRHGRENYVDMLLDLFNVFLATDSKINSLICTTCAQRLHDARDFKKLVLHAQSGFRLAATTEDQDTPTNPNTLKIKQEPQDEPEDPEPKTIIVEKKSHLKRLAMENQNLKNNDWKIMSPAKLIRS